MSYDTVAGIVLAGGRSRRMGQDKAALEFEGVTMLTRIAEAIGERCTPVLVAAPESSQAYRELSKESDLQWVTDEQDGSGPLGGLVAGLRAAAAAGAEVAFVCATDMPLVHADIVDELLAGLTPSTDAVIAHDSQRDHPMAGVYRTGTADALQALVDAGELRMLAAVDAISTRRVGVSNADWLTNVDAPEDLHRIRVAG
ncbi:putative molybdenum cofactor guanylyltransferase [Gordonia spumicola]|uniref:Probable molybdenum cofactor guanylyltransferase n=1 Tax=Gordonia spumicola TaxID=589161 RepID=A0A7I9VAN2_9ACTN|nr:molybdenum cofactor guanylyltransferase [Gordonia spumicola]GEE02375.1 putative molybdenum cofactor guanylyltransferase [Gordonia spumicola]